MDDLETPVWDRAQRIIDGLPTRKARMKFLKTRSPNGYIGVPEAIARFVIMGEQRGVKITVMQAYEESIKAFALGEVGTAVEIDGRHVPLPPSIYPLKH